MNRIDDKGQMRAPGRPKTPGIDIKPGDVRMRSPRSLSLAELTAAAGVSVRTVRYYIAEGLLPPPAGSGPKSSYTQAHLDRLRLINRLKEAYLPLREIRRQLAGMSDDEIRQLLAEAPAAVENRSAAAEPSSERPLLDSAAAYIDRLRQGQRAAAPPVMRAAAAPLASAPARPDADDVWRRVTLADGVELLMREEAYQRRRDRVDWLIRWARRVFQ